MNPIIAATIYPEDRSASKCIIWILLLALLIPGCSVFDPAKIERPATNSNQPGFDLPSTTIELAKPLETSSDPADLALCKEIAKTSASTDFPKSRWGIIVIGLSDGRVVCGQDAQGLFIPASIQKLITSAVSLDRLGGDYRFRTSVYAKKKIKKNGNLDGDLILYGRGSPDLSDKEIRDLVSQLKRKGLKRVKGNVIGDESYFTGDGLGDGWTWNSVQWYYGAAASALSVNDNQLRITVENGKPKAGRSFVELTGELKPVESIEAIGVKRELGTNKVYVWGNGKSLNARIAVNNPALFAARILKENLEKNGIRVSGGVKSSDWKNGRLKTRSADELASVESRALSDIIYKMNKDSVNLYAELILRTLGRKYGDQAPDADPKMQILRGDDSAGASVIKKWLRENDIADGEFAVHDGSGLSRLNLISPETIGRVLVFAAQSKFTGAFRKSLPVAGESGTLRGRLTNVRGKVIAKTGSITHVDSLAGYARSDRDTYAFAIIVNNETGKAGSGKTIDQIAALLTGE